MSVLGAHPNITSIRGITCDSRVLILEEAMTDLHQMIKSPKRSLSLPMVTRWAKLSYCPEEEEELGIGVGRAWGRERRREEWGGRGRGVARRSKDMIREMISQ